MSQSIIYNDAKTVLKAFNEIKHVDGWNNQFLKEKQTDSFRLPCALIQLQAQNFRDIGGSSGHQMYDCLMTLWIGFEAYNGADYSKLLDLKQRIFANFHRFEPTTPNERGEKCIGRFLRSDEEMEPDFDNVIVFAQSYLCQSIIDYDASTINTITQTLTPVITATFE